MIDCCVRLFLFNVIHLDGAHTNSYLYAVIHTGYSWSDQSGVRTHACVAQQILSLPP